MKYLTFILASINFISCAAQGEFIEYKSKQIQHDVTEKISVENILILNKKQKNFLLEITHDKIIKYIYEGSYYQIGDTLKLVTNKSYNSRKQDFLFLLYRNKACNIFNNDMMLCMKKK